MDANVCILTVDSSALTGFLTDVGKAFQQNILTLLVGSGTLLAMVSLRNGHIADRIRANIAEIIRLQEKENKGSSDDRNIVNLKEQNKHFQARHTMTAIASVCLAISIFIGPAIQYSYITHGGQNLLFAGMITLISYILIGVSAFLLIVEFCMARKTLRMHQELVL